jgi:hypothetical protein
VLVECSTCRSGLAAWLPHCVATLQERARCKAEDARSASTFAVSYRYLHITCEYRKHMYHSNLPPRWTSAQTQCCVPNIARQAATAKIARPLRISASSATQECHNPCRCATCQLGSAAGVTQAGNPRAPPAPARAAGRAPCASLAAQLEKRPHSMMPSTCGIALTADSLGRESTPMAMIAS